MSPEQQLEQQYDTERGPKVWLDLDQRALDIAYDQTQNAANFGTVRDRMKRASEQLLERLGKPRVYAYGSTPFQKLCFYPAAAAAAPIHVHIKGGAWLQKSPLDVIFPAECFLSQGASFAVLDFISVDESNGDLRPVLSDVCDGLAWVARNAASLGGDPSRLFVSGFSSGAHLASVALLCDWSRYGLAKNPYTAALLASGMYDLQPVRLSARSRYLAISDEIEAGMSAQRHAERFDIPLVLLYGDCESPEFQRQSRDFASTLQRAGKPVRLVVCEGYNHLEVMETLGNPFGPCGRAAIEQLRGKQTNVS